MYLECPYAIQVSTSKQPLISGIYLKTNQTRRQKPVWYNSLKKTYVFFSSVNDWHIAQSKHYTADNNVCYAFADGFSKSCPQDLDYTLWLNNKWTTGTDISVTSRK